MSALLNFFRSEHAQRAFAEVRAEKAAEDVLRVLRLRGLEITIETCERIQSCTDLDVLGTWLDRAVTAARTEELFD